MISPFLDGAYSNKFQFGGILSTVFLWHFFLSLSRSSGDCLCHEPDGWVTESRSSNLCEGKGHSVLPPRAPSSRSLRRRDGLRGELGSPTAWGSPQRRALSRRPVGARHSGILPSASTLKVSAYGGRFEDLNLTPALDGGGSGRGCEKATSQLSGLRYTYYSKSHLTEEPVVYQSPFEKALA
jgi:hypothetical protein